MLFSSSLAWAELTQCPARPPQGTAVPSSALAAAPGGAGPLDAQLVAARTPRRGHSVALEERAPRLVPQPGEMLVSVPSTVRKGDLDSYKKKRFSLAGCFDHQHHGCRSTRHDLRQAGACCVWGLRSPRRGESEGDSSPRPLHAPVAPCPQNPFRGVRTWRCRHVLESPSSPQPSLQPPRSQCPPRDPPPAGPPALPAHLWGGG